MPQDYPQNVERWRSLVEKHFPSYAVDKALWTLMHESSGNPGARNKQSGASGLFQILPSVHGQGNWTDPEENVKYAAKLYSRSGWNPWGGEGNTHNGKSFGALGKNPYPGDTQGRAMTSNAARSTLPVSSGRITQVFGRTDEPLDSGGTNKGLDISVPSGTAVSAVTGGTVVNAGDAGDGWGTSVKVRDAQGNIHNYGHLSGANVRKGDTVKAGQNIAKSGNTGASTGPHLSYDVKGANGQYVDPSPFLGFNAKGDNRQGHPAIGKDISELGGQMSQQSSSPTSSYWSDRVGQINDQIEHYEKLRETLGNLPETSLTDPAIQQQIQAVDSEIQNLQGMRDEAVMMSQQEQQSAADLALTQSQIDVQRINADVAAGRLTLDQAIHELNKDIKRRQTALAEETARRNQGRADAEFIDEQLDQAAAWAPSEPGKSDYTAADTSGAHAQMLEGRGISGDTTIANYGPTRTVDPQRTLAEAGGGAQGGRGSAPGMGWTDEDRAGGGEQPPGQGAAPPDTGTGTTGQQGGAGQAGGGEQFQPGASFGGNAAPRGHPAGGPTFGGNTPPRGHPAGAPSFPGNAPPSGHPAMAGPGGGGGGYDIGGLINSGIQAGRDFLPSLLDTDSYNVPGVDVGGLVDTGMSAGGGLLDSVFRTGGSSGQRFSGNTPQSGHPAMRRR